MSTFLTISIFFIQVLLLNFSKSEYEYETKYFNQQLDHFSYCNQATFLQRYLISDKYWKNSSGPIFFYTGNEGDITMFANNTGFMWEIAPKFDALLVFAEHRYYGETMPFGNQSYEIQNLGYLTSEQALADFATLIYYLKSELHAEHNSVVAFGGSYGGMLAAWFRIKYPHIVVGALASSAPVLQFGDLTPCEKFYEIVTEDFAQYGVECPKSIRRSWDIIRKYGKTESGATYLSSQFNLCNNMHPEDIDQFIYWIVDTYSFFAMVNYPYATDFMLPLPPYPIKEACKYLVKSSEPEEDLLLHIFQAISVYQNYTGDVKCFNISSSSSKTLGESGWDYQACTEMVMPLCQTGTSDMFEPVVWNFTSFSEDCLKKFKVKPDSQKVLMMYGGRNITSSSNIIFSNGKLDPWSAGGFLNSISDTIIAIVIDKGAHHFDLRSKNPKDSDAVIAARYLETKWITHWLNEARRTENRLTY